MAENLKGNPIGLHVGYLPDNEEHHTIQNIQQLSPSEFIASEKRELNFGFQTTPYWLTFTTSNSTQESISWFLEIGYSLIDDISLFVPKPNGGFREIKTGSQYPFKNRDFDFTTFIFRLNQEPGVNRYYLRVQSTGSLTIPLKVWNKASLDRHITIDLLLQGVFFGCMILMLLYNLIIYFSSLDKTYFAYVLLIFSVTMSCLILYGYGFRFIWPENPWMNKTAPFAMAWANISTFLFAITYLKTKKTVPRFHRILFIWLVMLLCFAVLALFLPYSYGIRATVLIQVSGVAVLLVLGVFCIIKKLRPAYFFFPGLLCLLLGAGIATLMSMNAVETNLVFYWGTRWGILGQTVIFSIGLADKLNSLKNMLAKTNSQLTELNLTLEQKVQKRTEALQKANKEMATMNENLMETRDQLWGEMQLAKKLQTVLLPVEPQMDGYDIAADMFPASLVGGDYYDVIDMGGYHWIVIGDVSGHGVTAGLIMMMAQTSIHTVLEANPKLTPSKLLTIVNNTIANNIKKMGEDKYMTITVLAAVKDGCFSFSGLHQDIYVYRAQSNRVEEVGTRGLWIGLMADNGELFHDDHLSLGPGDSMLLYTDGITESIDSRSSDTAVAREFALYGDARLKQTFQSRGDQSASEIASGILESLKDYDQEDDITFVVIKRLPAA